MSASKQLSWGPFRIDRIYYGPGRESTGPDGFPIGVIPIPRIEIHLVGYAMPSHPPDILGMPVTLVFGDGMPPDAGTAPPPKKTPKRKLLLPPVEPDGQTKP